MIKIFHYYISFVLVWLILDLVNARPQTASAFVHEVTDPEDKKKFLFDNFKNGLSPDGQRRSILYQSFVPQEVTPTTKTRPQFGQILGEIVVEVESPQLTLRKPENREEKLKDKIAKQIAARGN